MFLYLWRCFDERGLTSHWRAALARDDIYYAYLVIACSGEWVSDFSRGWRCNDVICGGLAKHDEICLHLTRLKGSPKLASLTDEEICKLISFAEGDADPDFGRRYSEDDAILHVAEWRGEQGSQVPASG